MVNDQEISVEERLAKAKKPGQDAMKMHPYYGGKIEVVPITVVYDAHLSRCLMIGIKRLSSSHACNSTRINNMV